MSADPFAELKASAMADAAQPADPFADLKASAQAEAAPIKPTAQSQIKDAMAGIKNGFPTITGAIKKGIDWLGQLGQPQAARDYAQKVAQSPDLPQAPGPSLPPGFTGEVGAAPPSGPVAHAVAGGVVNAATQPMTYGPAILDAARAIPWLRGVAKIPESATTALASKLTHLPGEALTAASTTAGRADLAQSAKNAPGMGDEFTSQTASLTRNMPEAATVNEALKNMAPIDREKIIAAMESKKIAPNAGVILPQDAIANARIDEQIQALRGIPPDRLTEDQFQKQLSDLETKKFSTNDFKSSNAIENEIQNLKSQHAANPPLPNEIPAEEARNLNTRLGTSVNFNDPQAGQINAANKAGYRSIVQQLESGAEKTGNPEYAPAMKSMHDRYDLNSELQDMIGKEDGARQDIRAENFLNGLWKTDAKGNLIPGAQVKQDLLKRLDDAQGTNLLENSKRVYLAKQFGPEGTPSWVPNVNPMYGLGEAAAGGALGHFSGHPILGPMIGASTIAGSSPAVAVRAIEASRLPPWIIKKTLQNSPALSAASAADNTQANLPPWVR